MSVVSANLELRFDGSSDAAIHWAARSALEHALDMEALEELYDRALPYLRAWAYALIKHGWEEEHVDAVGEIPLALCLGRDEQIIVEQGEFSTPHTPRLVLPRHFSAFTDPTLAHDWATMFSNLIMTTDPVPAANEVFQLGRAGMPRPLQNILYLLQSLSPGLIVVRDHPLHDGYSKESAFDAQITDCGLPPALWVGEHIEDLEDIFGSVLAVNLYKAADDPYAAVEDVELDSYADNDGEEDDDTLSDTSFATLSSDEDWASWDHPADAVLAAFDKAELELSSHPLAKTNGSKQHQHHQVKPVAEVIYDDADPADYRHCDAACHYCGRCSEAFATRLTQLLTMAITA